MALFNEQVHILENEQYRVQSDVRYKSRLQTFNNGFGYANNTDLTKHTDCQKRRVEDITELDCINNKEPI